MGRAPSAEANELNEETRRLLHAAASEEDARTASWGMNALVTAVAMVFALGPTLPGGAFVFGPVTGGQTFTVTLIAWGLFECRFLALRTLGADHPTTRALAVLDELGRYGAPLAIIYASGSVSSPLWVVTMAKGIAFPASTPERARRDLRLLCVSHGCMLLALLASRRIADGAFTVLVIFGVIALQTMTARTLATRFRMNAERNVLERRLHHANLSDDRDRIARELHDGVGADVTALLLRLRARAKDGTNPRAAAFSERAQAILDDLRAVVWSLRREQGTLGELGKLIDATCRPLREAPGYERVTEQAQSRAPIAPEVALTTLALVRELSRDAASRKGGGPLRIRLQLAEELVLDIDGGLHENDDDAERVLEAMRRRLAEHTGTLTRSPSGIRVRIPCGASAGHVVVNVPS